MRIHDCRAKRDNRGYASIQVLQKGLSMPNELVGYIGGLIRAVNGDWPVIPSIDSRLLEKLRREDGRCGCRIVKEGTDNVSVLLEIGEGQKTRVTLKVLAA